MTDRTGQQLGNYRLVRLLGSGGFAEVYLGEHVHLNTKAAIKVLTARLTTEEIEQFRSEARTIARLRHPYIVRVLDFGVDNAIPFLVMDYAPNGTLRDRHPKGTLPLDTIIHYIRQVASALQYAHDNRLIHRDVKPENMLLGANYEVLLSDFGLAVVAHSTRSQRTEGIGGTWAYMAPEQFHAHPSRASDQYALGIVVYEWLSGTPPFRGDFAHLMHQHIYVLPPSLCERVPTISPEVEQVVFTALAKNSEARFASVAAFAQAFERARAAPPARPKRFQPEDYRAARRWGAPWGVIAALAVGGAVALARALGIAGNAITPGTILIESLVYLVVLICPLCGLLAARQTGRVRSGALAAFVVGALWVLAITIGVFYEDAVPKLSHESVVVLIAAYLVGLLVLAPIGGLIGGVLGALGGLVGRWRYRAHK